MQLRSSKMIIGITLLCLSSPALALGADLACYQEANFDDVLVWTPEYLLVTFLIETLYGDICIVILALASLYISRRNHPKLSKCILAVTLAGLVCREYAFYQYSTYYYPNLSHDPIDGYITLGEWVENISPLKSRSSLIIRNMSLRIVVAFSLVGRSLYGVTFRYFKIVK